MMRRFSQGMWTRLAGSSLSNFDNDIKLQMIFNVYCRGPAPVDPGNSKGGRSRRGKNLFIYYCKIRLERNSVVGKLSGRRGLNNLDYAEDQ